MNQNAVVHLHTIPRYHTPRRFAGTGFPVVDALDGGNVRLPATSFARLAADLRSQLAPIGAEAT